MTVQAAREIRDGAILILALAALSENQRHAITGCALRGLTREQCAAEMGCSRQRVNQHYAKGMRYLRARLAMYRDDLMVAA